VPKKQQGVPLAGLPPPIGQSLGEENRKLLPPVQRSLGGWPMGRAASNTEQLSSEEWKLAMLMEMPGERNLVQNSLVSSPCQLAGLVFTQLN